MRWSALRRDLKKLWVEDIKADIHQTSYVVGSRSSSELPRLWFTLDKEVILDFWKDYKEPVNGKIDFYPCDIRKISDTLRTYINTPVKDLMNPTEGDFTKITDLLRALDKRLGKEKLLSWMKDLHPLHPSRKILAKRFNVKESYGIQE